MTLKTVRDLTLPSVPPEEEKDDFERITRFRKAQLTTLKELQESVYDDLQNIPKIMTHQVEGTTDVNMNSTTLADMPDMSISYTSSVSEKMLILFEAPCRCYVDGSSQIAIVLDGVIKQRATAHHHALDYRDFFAINICHSETLPAGSHAIKVQWRRVISTGAYALNQYSSYADDGTRKLTVIRMK